MGSQWLRLDSNRPSARQTDVITNYTTKPCCRSNIFGIFSIQGSSKLYFFSNKTLKPQVDRQAKFILVEKYWRVVFSNPSSMATSLDMSLDDIIKSNKHKPRGTSFRGRAPRNSGPSRRIPNRFPNRAAPYAKVTSIQLLLELFSQFLICEFRFRGSVNRDRNRRSEAP